MFNALFKHNSAVLKKPECVQMRTEINFELDKHKQKQKLKGIQTAVTMIIFVVALCSYDYMNTNSKTNTKSYLPTGTTTGTPTGVTVIIVMVEPIWVASADWVFVFTDPNVAWKSLLLLLFRLLLLFTITLLT